MSLSGGCEVLEVTGTVVGGAGVVGVVVSEETGTGMAYGAEVMVYKSPMIGYCYQ